MGFADPEFRLAFAIPFNGMPDGDKHNKRIWAVTNALYQDLGFDWGRTDKVLGDDLSSITA